MNIFGLLATLVVGPYLYTGTDDLKLYAVLATDIDVSNFNSTLKCIEEWANTCQLQLSVEKCCIFEINKKHSTSPTSSFCLNGVSLPTTNIVKDLGITVNDSLTPCTHIAKITATAHQRVNLIVRSFTSRDIYVTACIFYIC